MLTNAKEHKWGIEGIYMYFLGGDLYGIYIHTSFKFHTFISFSAKMHSFRIQLHFKKNVFKNKNQIRGIKDV